MLHLVRYGEIGIKSEPVRARLESRLVENLKSMAARARLECFVKRERGRLFFSAGDDAATRKQAESLLKRTFGVVSFSPVSECPAGLDEMKRLAVSLSSPWPSCRFAVRPRRTGTHKYTSRDIGVAIGRAIQDSAGKRMLDVDLGAPEKELHVEVRERRAFLFEAVLAGPGGFPVGSQGKVGAVIRTEQDAAAAWMTMKRGCGVIAAGDEAMIKLLEPWAPSVKRLKSAAPDPRPQLIRRGAEAIVDGGREPIPAEELGGPAGRRILMLQPLVGLDDEEVEAIVERLRSPP